MLKSAVKVRIYRPVEEVFAYITNPQNDVEWNADLREVRDLPEGALQVGDTFSMVFQPPEGQTDPVVMTQEVTEMEPEKSFAFKTVAGSEIPITGSYAFAPAEVGSTVQYIVTYDVPDDLPERIIKNLKREINKRLETNFTQLKTLLDTQEN